MGGNGAGHNLQKNATALEDTIQTPYDPAIPFLGIYPDKTFLKKDTYTCMFIYSTIHNSQDMETTQMSINI